jgi:energy-converting hydrogenase Eha subunit G
MRHISMTISFVFFLEIHDEELMNNPHFEAIILITEDVWLTGFGCIIW